MKNVSADSNYSRRSSFRKPNVAYIITTTIKAMTFKRFHSHLHLSVSQLLSRLCLQVSIAIYSRLFLCPFDTLVLYNYIALEEICMI